MATASAELSAIAERMRRQYRTSTQAAAAAIREAIVGAVFRPGDPLNVYELADWLGVSRTPVRIALAELESDGLVMSLPRRGAVVAEPDVADFLQLYEIRSQLELLAVELAVTTMTPERLARLERIDDELERAAAVAASALRDEFYDVLYGGTGNPMLASMIRQSRTETAEYETRLGVATAATDRHVYLLGYVRDGNVPGARRYLADQLEAVRKRCAT